MRVKIGASRRSQKKDFQEIDVADIIAHENFEKEPSYNNDIALLKLKKPYEENGINKHILILSIFVIL